MHDAELAQILAWMGAGYIANANQLTAQQRLTQQLTTALRSRDVIGQAKGIIMAQAGLDEDQPSNCCDNDHKKPTASFAMWPRT